MRRSESWRQTVAQRNRDGRYIKDFPEARRLTEASRSQIIYNRQKEMKDEKTKGVQRMKKKKRRELKKDAMRVNERITASWQFETVLNKAVRTHTDELVSDLNAAVEELNQTKAQVKDLVETKGSLWLRVNDMSKGISSWRKKRRLSHAKCTSGELCFFDLNTS